jgi:Nucleotidyl transferase AbiEii toxin, Type IV TA system
VENGMIPEPQRTYVLELLAALGPAATEFIVAGAQAIKFAVPEARGTKDVDFILNVIALREETVSLEGVLHGLRYTAVEGARNFQFEKAIPNSGEKMRIEFMAPEEFKRAADFRVDVQRGIHARACTGGTIALAESDEFPLEGKLPDGTPYAAKVRVTRPHALVMLKLLALYDRYHNIRGPREAGHDREEAQTHAADIVAVVKAHPDLPEFKRQFEGQFHKDEELGTRVSGILDDFFRAPTAPGYLLYEEYLAAQLPAGRGTQAKIRDESALAHRILQRILPERNPPNQE